MKNKTVNPTLAIDYPIHIRFLDMKENGKGFEKENYYPIYNKPLYGFIFSYAYKQLRYGLLANIRENQGLLQYKIDRHSVTYFNRFTILHTRFPLGHTTLRTHSFFY
ncbi:MAG: hypothetical protein JEZ14_11615 [Marinilabiliaceae bacterium]|nr:hypothetical protein [Marinilabiliaceae bacterium]